MNNEQFQEWYQKLDKADRWAHCGSREAHEAHQTSVHMMDFPCSGTPDLTAVTTSTVYRVERQEVRARNPLYGQWVRDQWTTLHDIPDADTAIALAKSPVGPYAWQPWRVLEIVTTEKVFYTNS